MKLTPAKILKGLAFFAGGLLALGLIAVLAAVFVFEVYFPLTKSRRDKEYAASRLEFEKEKNKLAAQVAAQAQAEAEAESKLPHMEARIIETAVSKNGPFNYYQLHGSWGDGIVGKLLLNNEKIVNFNGQNGSFTGGLNPNKLRDGENIIELEINTVDEKISKAFNPYTMFEEDKGKEIDAVVRIDFHGVNEQVMPDATNRILALKWNPENKKPDHIKYRFDFNR